jgi:hypothetical protein
VALCGCKEKSGETKPQELIGSENGDSETIDSDKPAAPIDAQSIPTLSEQAIAMYQTSTNSVQPVHWKRKGEEIALRVEAGLATGTTGTYDAKIYALVPGAEDLPFFECKGLRAVASGRIDAVLRGDMLHVLCINAAQAEDPGTTDAGRFDFDLGTRLLTPAGTYGGDGSLDLDTIDLDEGE